MGRERKRKRGVGGDDGEGGGASQIGRPAKGGRAKSDDPSRGAKNFGRPVKGGRKILDLVNFCSMFLKHNFSCFVVFWALLIFLS